MIQAAVHGAPPAISGYVSFSTLRSGSKTTTVGILLIVATQMLKAAPISALV